MPKERVDELKAGIKNGQINDWDDVHHFYRTESNRYQQEKLVHAYASLLELNKYSGFEEMADDFTVLQNQMVETKRWMVKNIYESRAKDYENDFRQMVYHNKEEMNAVVGKLEDNAFINQQYAELENIEKWIGQPAT
jgi:hypothetical protein